MMATWLHRRRGVGAG